VLTGFRFGDRCSHGLCSYGLRRRSCKLDQYHGQPSDGQRYKQSSGPSRLYSDWTLRERQKSGIVASRRSFVEDFADKLRYSGSHDWLDGGSDLLCAGQCHHHRDCSRKPAAHCEQRSAEHGLLGEWYRHTGLSIVPCGSGRPRCAGFFCPDLSQCRRHTCKLCRRNSLTSSGRRDECRTSRNWAAGSSRANLAARSVGV
jgi:hypothetical protein